MEWFKSEHLPDWSKDYNVIEKIVSITKAYKRMGFEVKDRHWDMSYEVYTKLQSEAHKVYGCNFKRALRMFGFKNKVRRQTRNGHWVWMK